MRTPATPVCPSEISHEGGLAGVGVPVQPPYLAHVDAVAHQGLLIAGPHLHRGMVPPPVAGTVSPRRICRASTRWRPRRRRSRIRADAAKLGSGKKVCTSTTSRPAVSAGHRGNIPARPAGEAELRRRRSPRGGMRPNGRLREEDAVRTVITRSCPVAVNVALDRMSFELLPTHPGPGPYTSVGGSPATAVDGRRCPLALATSTTSPISGWLRPLEFRRSLRWISSAFSVAIRLCFPAVGGGRNRSSRSAWRTRWTPCATAPARTTELASAACSASPDRQVSVSDE